MSGASSSVSDSDEAGESESERVLVETYRVLADGRTVPRNLPLGGKSQWRPGMPLDGPLQLEGPNHVSSSTPPFGVRFCMEDPYKNGKMYR